MKCHICGETAGSITCRRCERENKTSLLEDIRNKDVEEIAKKQLAQLEGKIVWII